MFWRKQEPARPYLCDITPDEEATWRAVKPYTMTPRERVVALIRAVEYVARNSIVGDVVECGVWKGGSMMTIARTLLQKGDTGRILHLFDTYEGMPEPGKRDVARRTGKSAAAIMKREDKSTSLVWAIASLELVKKNIYSTNYPDNLIRFIRGRVEETVPRDAPDKIALLRLDTDWYESTRHELIHLFPRLVTGGVLIIDDYGHWAGCRKAVDEYFDEHKIPMMLFPIDYSGRIGIKP